MQEQTGRQSFRFRIPYWANPQPTPFEPQPPTQPTIPTQRQLFRASVALQPPPQSQQAPARTQAQAPSPSRTTSLQPPPQPPTRTQAQAPSPSRTTSLPPPPQPQQAPTRTQAQAPSPSRTTSQPQLTTRTTSQPPSRTTSQPQLTTLATSQPPSPSRTTSQPQLTTRTTSQPPSPSRQPSQLQPKPPTPSQPSSPSRQASQLQPKPPTPSQPQSPPRQASQLQLQPKPPTLSQPQSPSRQASRLQPKPPTPSQPKSPTRQASQLQPKPPTPSQPPSPSRQALQPQAVTRITSQPPATSHMASKPQSQTPSPSRASQPRSTTQTTSKPPSPSRQASQLQKNSPTTTQPQSPPPQTSQLELKSPVASQLSSPSLQSPRSEAVTRTASQPPSPSQTNSKPPSPSRQASQPSSPSRTGSKTPSSPPPVTQLQLVPQTSFPPPLPSHEADQTQHTTTQTTSPPQSPSHKIAQNQHRLTQLLSEDPQHQEESSHQPALQSKAHILCGSETGDQTPPTKPTLQPVSLASQPTLVAESDPLVALAPSTATPETLAMPQSLETTVDSLNPAQPPKSETKLAATTIDEKPQLKPETHQSQHPRTPTYEEPNQAEDVKLSNMISSQSKQRVGQSVTASRDMSETTIVQPERPGEPRVVDKNETTSICSNGKERKMAVITNTRERKAESKLEIRGLTSSGGRATLQKEMKEGASRLVNKMAVGDQEQLSEEHNVNVITIAGENKGSSMNVGYDTVHKDGSLHIHRGYKLNKNAEAELTKGDREGTNSDQKLNHNSSSESQKPAIATCTNNNVQIINNSILYDSSCDARNPGAHIHFVVSSNNPTKAHKLKGNVESDFDRSSAGGGQNLMSQQQPGSRVRRRCLRGLFLESSESEGANPQKPQRHGCRYNCAADSKKVGKDGQGNSSSSTTNGRKNGKEVVGSSSKP